MDGWMVDPGQEETNVLAPTTMMKAKRDGWVGECIHFTRGHENEVVRRQPVMMGYGLGTWLFASPVLEGLYTFVGTSLARI
jgi:hypothetical protein